MTKSPAILGWDIGGVNIKVARLESESEGLPRSVSLPFALQRQPETLAAMLIAAAAQAQSQPDDVHAVTMTAELSQAFRTKREGVGFILDAVEAAFPDRDIQAYTVDDRFVGLTQARIFPLSVAASNWAATAHRVARTVPTCVLVDIGSTSTDLIPIIEGRVTALGHTDPERLLSSELVYSGALRTPAEAVVRQVPLWGGAAGVSADGFAIIGDAHLWQGNLSSEDYTCPAPDGRPATKVFAGERLARLVCADRDMLDETAIDDIARALVSAQVRTVAGAIQRIRARWPAISIAVVTGLGDFIAVEAARAAGLTVVSLSEEWGEASRIAPAAAVAWLFREWLRSNR
jgi:(4-(4-[2-(gamma-L-glutamylamino)ethyl]phenoxymethyl)furan-2-yl)methanamine synthase